MTTEQTNKPSKWFWIIGIIALLWNLMGAMAYLMEAYMPDEARKGMTEAQTNMLDATPAWVTGAFAIAVWGGVLGCIFLLMRKKWAKPVFIISFLAVVARTVYYFFMTDAASLFDAVQGIVLPIAVVIIAILLIIYTNKSIKKGWLR